MAEYKIYHNPRCSKSRQTLEILNEKGVDVEIVEYLKNPPGKSELTAVIKALGVTPSDIMRKKEAEYQEAGLDQEGLSVEQQVEKMIAYPKVIERPIVVKGNKAVVGRPPENVLDLID
ncbi:arsenate reductase (glutaredoxin) [Aliikangiella sp. G2MR2-5]|uniref:arsenate reductase (glutaredoxin) n=1 Tax=Aliikangiella sp. G2MR2-5 TaxID=2788943 RepID=UPI0018AAAE21|nr:arsenate reductase (glutaredoxin) [Aliikangiella sp. G2MR2-5]